MLVEGCLVLDGGAVAAPRHTLVLRVVSCAGAVRVVGLVARSLAELRRRPGLQAGRHDRGLGEVGHGCVGGRGRGLRLWPSAQGEAAIRVGTQHDSRAGALVAARVLGVQVRPVGRVVQAGRGPGGMRTHVGVVVAEVAAVRGNGRCSPDAAKQLILHDALVLDGLPVGGGFWCPAGQADRVLDLRRDARYCLRAVLSPDGRHQLVLDSALVMDSLEISGRFRRSAGLNDRVSHLGRDSRASLINVVACVGVAAGGVACCSGNL